MTKKEAIRYAWLENALSTYGFTRRELDTLLRAEKTLHTWAEHECNGAIQRDEVTGKPYWHNTDSGKRLYSTSDRETGTLKRVTELCQAHGVSYYHQTDPRGCALYLIRPEDVSEGAEAASYYTRGIALCL